MNLYNIIAGVVGFSVFSGGSNEATSASLINTDLANGMPYSSNRRTNTQVVSLQQNWVGDRILSYVSPSYFNFTMTNDGYIGSLPIELSVTNSALTTWNSEITDSNCPPSLEYQESCRFSIKAAVYSDGSELMAANDGAASGTLLSNSTWQPSGAPSHSPTGQPSHTPSRNPTGQLSGTPLSNPTGQPSHTPSSNPTEQLSGTPSRNPTGQPSGTPSSQLTSAPTFSSYTVTFMVKADYPFRGAPTESQFKCIVEDAESPFTAYSSRKSDEGQSKLNEMLVCGGLLVACGSIGIMTYLFNQKRSLEVNNGFNEPLLPKTRMDLRIGR